MWVDSHAHLQLASEEPEILLDRAADVDWVVVPGIDVASSKAALELQGRRPDGVVASAGLHPHDARHWNEQAADLNILARTAGAVGETGLDFYRNLSPPSAQLSAFRAQAELAIELDKPLIVHCRDAFEDTYEAIDSLGCGDRSVMHCWTGGRRWTKRFLELGVVFSFAGPITFPTGETVRAAAAEVPPERGLVETDTPYLTPPPERHLPNEPANVAFVGSALAEVWGLPVTEVAGVTSRTAARLFRS